MKPKRSRSSGTTKQPFKPEKYYYVAVSKRTGWPYFDSLRTHREPVEAYMHIYTIDSYRIAKVKITEVEK